MRRVDLAAMEKEALPEALQAMRLEERKAYIAEKAAQRQTLQDAIAALAWKRQAFFEAKVKEEGGVEKRLDDQLYR